MFSRAIFLRVQDKDFMLIYDALCKVGFVEVREEMRKRVLKENGQSAKRKTSTNEMVQGWCPRRNAVLLIRIGFNTLLGFIELRCCVDLLNKG